MRPDNQDHPITLSRKMGHIIFWDYNPESINDLPQVMIAQRCVNQWPEIAEALKAKQLSGEDVLPVVKLIMHYRKRGELMFDDDVRKEVIAHLYHRFCQGGC